jgi:multidrug resistance efflux pump
MRPLVIVFVIFTFILSSCWSSVDTISPWVSWESKTPFNVDTMLVGTTQAQLSVEKTWRITASSTLTLAAQGVWEISNIAVREGQSVKAGTVIATLKDTQTNYDLRLTQAENTLAIQNASIETTRINLDNTVEGARVAYERARQSYDTLMGKNALQYDTVVNNNEKTLKGYNEVFRNYLSDAEKNMTSLLYDGDKILGITTNYEYANDAWEPYLGARAWDTRALAIGEWNRLYTARGELRARLEKNKSIDISNPQADFDLVTKSYNQTRVFADAMLYMIQNNVVGGGLPQTMQDGWIASWNAYRTQIGASESGFNSWRSQTINFFDSYKNTELATKIALASIKRALTAEELAMISSWNTDLRLTYETTKLTLTDTIKNAKLSLEQSETAYKNAIALKDATLVQLLATKKNADIALEQARRDYSKLRIIAPVDGVISKVIWSVGQSVNLGTPITDFTSKQPQIIIDIDSSLARTLEVWESVWVRIEQNNLSGTITAVSTVSNTNLLSTVRIAVAYGEKHIGKSAIVIFGQDKASNSDVVFVPIHAVKIISEGEGEIYILTHSGILESMSVRLGAVRDASVEILSSIGVGTTIVVSDVSNYDPQRQSIQVQNKK